MLSGVEGTVLTTIIEGLGRHYMNKLIPHIIIEMITLFCDFNNIYPFNIFNQNFHKISQNTGKQSLNVDNNENNDRIDNITNIYINGKSIYCVTNEYMLCGFGFNNKYQIIKPDSSKINRNKYIDNITKIEHFCEHSIKFCSQSLIDRLNFHYFAYTMNNELYAMGYNRYYQTGIESDLEYNISKPILIQYNFKSKLVFIKCGLYHTLFLNKNGNVYGCGSNHFGQLSLNNKDKYPITHLSLFNNIIDIYCCNYTSYVINIDNHILSFGSNKFGCLGIGSNDINTINIVSNNINIISFNTGNNHIGYINRKGILHMFGDNTNKQCGNIVTQSWYNADITKPTILNINHKLISIKCGDNHTIIKTSKHYYAFGLNDNLQCFDTHNSIVSTPQRISIQYIYNKTHSNNKIIDIIPGVGVSFILQKI